MTQYMFTGFPGFIASKLFHALQEKSPSASFVFLVHPTQLTKARHMCSNPHIQLLPGDITKEHLGLSKNQLKQLQEEVTHVFHLAALYNLAVPKEAAHAVNVVGTEHVNRFVRSLNNLQRYVYFSTAYVSGDREGPVTEDELDCGQGFKNHYEWSKFEAEKKVAQLEGVPVTILRPGIVVGDSQTGETAKFDGPYFIMRFLDALRQWPIPYIGKGEAYFNMVPVDYIVEASLALAHSEKAVNQTFHLTSPSPPRVRELIHMISEELLGKKPALTAPFSLFEMIMKLPPIPRWLSVQKESLVYLSSHAEYDCRKARSILLAAGIDCPDVADYLPQIISFYKRHRDDHDKKIAVE
ncbi:SDR family oxidoreductase [Laceyella putida]|uniref:SDR family oxidoreductase n=1 Tax=Laceyella putida TaxID=110101 RepID=A0ABW2RH44_9BACL